jgi:hypothetical protein
MRLVAGERKARILEELLQGLKPFPRFGSSVAAEAATRKEKSVGSANCIPRLRNVTLGLYPDEYVTLPVDG